MDSPLTERGIQHARNQAALLDGLDLTDHARLTSPQGRARRTADIALGPSTAADPRLREIGMGDWSGIRIEDIRVTTPEAFAGPPLSYYDHAPNGEGLAALEARCRDFLAELAGPAVIVTHGITSRMLRSLALTGSGASFSDLPGGQGVVHIVEDGRHSTLGSALHPPPPIR